jgi:hypothetical protein
MGHGWNISILYVAVFKGLVGLGLGFVLKAPKQVADTSMVEKD